MSDRVESFDLDHTKVRAPYLRLAGQKAGPKGDLVNKYDLRLKQPNREFIGTAALHTLEHLLAKYLREEFPNQIIDVSPMGCRTGMYFTMFPDGSSRSSAGEVFHVFGGVRRALVKVSQHDGPIPGSTYLECGNYLDHSIFVARQIAETTLASNFKIQETILIDRSKDVPPL